LDRTWKALRIVSVLAGLTQVHGLRPLMEPNVFCTVAIRDAVSTHVPENCARSFVGVVGDPPVVASRAALAIINNTTFGAAGITVRFLGGVMPFFEIRIVL
jgi:hypothetical protein